MACFAFLVSKADPWITLQKYGSYPGQVIGDMEEKNPFWTSCFDPPQSTPDFKKCTASVQKEAPSSIAVFGDSHANAFFPMLDSFAKTHPVSVVQYTRVGYKLPVSVSSVAPNIERFSKQIEADLSHRISSKPQFRVSAVLASRFVNYSGRASLNSGAISTEELKRNLTTFEESLEQSILHLEAFGVYRILIVLPYPEFESDPIHCFRAHSGKYGDCFTLRADFEAYRKEVMEVIQSVSARHAEVRLSDPASALCNEIRCPQFLSTGMENIPVVYDENHPSVKAAKRLATLLEKDLLWLTQ